ncbi:TPA: DUF1525 domain-containing protein [Vibrio vulnificus]|nr:DUF1525 domain-containing protein [Vibrio vulnificus]
MKIGPLLGILYTLCTPALAMHMEVFCLDEACIKDVEQRSSSIDSVVVDSYQLNRGISLEKMLEEKLKNSGIKTELEGQKLLSDWMNSNEGRDEVARLKWDVNGIAKSVNYDIQKLPAFVCNGSLVVYGGGFINAYKTCLAQVNQRK